MLSKKLKSNQGFSLFPGLLIIVLAAAVIALVGAVFILPFYQDHVKDRNLTMDALSVRTAEDVAKIQYLQDGDGGLVVYYYDELTHKAVKRDQLAAIKPYGRATREQNRNGESGAKGVPNLEDRGGAQIIALAIDGGESVNARWTGKTWTYPDYYYMTQKERKKLKQKDLKEMDASSEKLAKSLAIARYENDFRKELKDGKHPGKAVYVYDALEDTVVYNEEAMKELGMEAATLPKNVQVNLPKNVDAYDVAHAHGNVVQVTVYLEGGAPHAQSKWVEGRH